MVSRSPGHSEGSMLVPHALSWTAPWHRSISAARPSLGFSRSSSGSVYGMDGPQLRSMPVESALRKNGLNLAAGQCHGLENPLVPERRFLILLFHDVAAPGCVLLARVQVLFIHENRVAVAQTAESAKQLNVRTNHFLCKAYTKRQIKPIITAGSGQKIGHRAPKISVENKR